MLRNRNLFLISMVVIVNALGYGIVIPVLYSYSQKFGLSDFQNGLLFSVFSICQFIATPLIGRLSDKYGRRPLLIVSITGTALSFFMMAFAPSALFLFLARALDGITAGNLPVAAAVISDTMPPKERARGFGIIWAAFGFGFVFGPAIAAVTVGFGQQVPFILAGIVTVIAVILTTVFLPETNMHRGEVKKAKVFDLRKLFTAVFDPQVGAVLVISLSYFFGFSLFLYAFQPQAVKGLHMNASEISSIFTLFGIVGLVMQLLVIPRVTKAIGETRALAGSLGLASFCFFLYFIGTNIPVFILATGLFALANAFVNPLIQAILSREADEASQGSILGLSASYQSIGMIVGPIAGGALATVSFPLPFFVGSIVVAGCTMLAIKLHRKVHHKLSTFEGV